MNRWCRITLGGIVGAMLTVTIGCDESSQSNARVGGAARTTLVAGERVVSPALDEDRLKWGVYQILHGANRYAQNLDLESARLGARPDYVLFFRDLGRPYPFAVCQAVIDRGAIPVISLELHHWGGPRAGRLEAIVEGKYDPFFASFAESAAKSGHVVYYRFGFEMNGDWFGWGNQPELFKSAWRHVHAIFKEQGCDNVQWVWSANAISGPNTPQNGLEKYWPGDDCVDLIGLDGYNFGDGHSEWHTWIGFEEIFGPALEKIRESGVPHPVLISEFGCTHTPANRRAPWIRDAYRYLKGRPEVVGAIWFNFDKRREGEPNWRIDADAESLRVFRETFAGGADKHARRAETG